MNLTLGHFFEPIFDRRTLFAPSAEAPDFLTDTPLGRNRSAAPGNSPRSYSYHSSSFSVRNYNGDVTSHSKKSFRDHTGRHKFFESRTLPGNRRLTRERDTQGAVNSTEIENVKSAGEFEQEWSQRFRSTGTDAIADTPPTQQQPVPLQGPALEQLSAQAQEPLKLSKGSSMTSILLQKPAGTANVSSGRSANRGRCMLRNAMGA